MNIYDNNLFSRPKWRLSSEHYGTRLPEIMANLQEIMEERYKNRLREIRTTVDALGGPIKRRFLGIRDYYPQSEAAYRIDDWRGDVSKLKNFIPTSQWFITKSSIYYTQISFMNVEDLILFRLACS